MAYISAKIYSEVLCRRVEVNMFFPNDLPIKMLNKPKAVLYLLHGFSNTGDDWVQMSAAGRYAADNSIILIMPNMDNSFYNNNAYGIEWYTYITNELPQLLNSMFKIPCDASKTFVAGLSMGGYGALLLGLSRPDLYAGCASFSGCVDLGAMIKKQDTRADREMVEFSFMPVFGESLEFKQTSDLFYLAKKVSEMPRDKQPKIMCTTGKDDHAPYYIYEQNAKFKAELDKMNLNSFKYMEWSGVHEWNFWDRSLTHAIAYFLDNDYDKKKQNDWVTE